MILFALTFPIALLGNLMAGVTLPVTEWAKDRALQLARTGW